MKNDGAPLRLTEKAFSYILDTVTSAINDPEYRDLYPVMSWISSTSSDPEFFPGPNIALDYKGNLDRYGDDVYIVDKFRIPIAVGGERREEFFRKILDFRKGRLLLIFADDFPSSDG